MRDTILHATPGRVCDTLSDIGPFPDDTDPRIHLYHAAMHTRTDDGRTGELVEVVAAVCAPLGLSGIHVIHRTLGEAPGPWQLDKGGALDPEVAAAITALIGSHLPWIRG